MGVYPDDATLQQSLKEVRDRRRHDTDVSVASSTSRSITSTRSKETSVATKKRSNRVVLRSSRAPNEPSGGKRVHQHVSKPRQSEKGKCYGHQNKSADKAENFRFDEDSVYECQTEDSGEDAKVEIIPPKISEESSIKKLIIEDLWSDRAEIVEKGLKKLSSILGVSKHSPNAQRNREIIFRAGGHLAIVQAMKKHRNKEAVQGEGCRALGIAAEEIMDSGNENAIAIVGGIDAILTAMKTFKHDEQIQDFGCGALQNLTGLEANAKILVESDGVSVILSSMRSFPKSTLVQESACWTIVNLCLHKENKSYLERARCFGIVGAAMDNHPRSVPVKTAAQDALQNLLEILGPSST